MATVQEKDNVLTLFFSKTKSAFRMQRRYRTQYGEAGPSDNVIRLWLKQFQETGSVLHRKKWEKRALRRKMLLESRKLGHLT
jgi:hypothetical protein